MRRAAGSAGSTQRSSPAGSSRRAGGPATIRPKSGPRREERPWLGPEASREVALGLAEGAGGYMLGALGGMEVGETPRERRQARRVHTGVLAGWESGHCRRRSHRDLDTVNLRRNAGTGIRWKWPAGGNTTLLHLEGPGWKSGE